MTETMIDLPGVIAKSDDADFLRELIQDAAQRLMDIEVYAVCGAGHGERSSERENQRNGYRPRRWDTRPCRPHWRRQQALRRQARAY